MDGRAQKSLRRVFLVITCSVALYAGLSLAAGAIVRSRLQRMIEQAGARIAKGHEPALEISLFSGGISLTGLVLEADTVLRPAVHLDGRVDTLSITGLSYWGLLRGHVKVRHVHVRARDLAAVLRLDTTAVDTSIQEEGVGRIQIDAADIGLERISLVAIGGDTSSITANALSYQGDGVSLYRDGRTSWSFALLGERAIRIDSLYADLLGEQCAEVGALHLDQHAGTCTIAGTHFGPYVDLETFAKQQPLEVDVVECVMPSIHISGIRLPSHVDAHDWSARNIAVENADVVIFRDKTRPDGPYKYMPLIARLLRKLPLDAGVDTVVLSNADIVYNERATHERGFGRVPFRRMNALVTGARNARSDSAMLSIHATCTAFVSAPVDFTLTTRVQDTTDHFDVVARIGTMPFRDLNVAFGPLADIQAMSGTLDTVVMRLSADDRVSRGKVRLAYHDLRMVQGDEATEGARTRPLSVLMNAIIPNDKAEGDLAETDELYTLSRRRDRSMFNYLWINLREGSKKVVLPGFLEKR